MRKFILLLFIILSLFNYLISKDYKEIKNKALKFTQELIANPEDIENILKDSSEISSRRIFEREYSEFDIKHYKEIIRSQNKADFELSEVKFININNIDSSRVAVVYIKRHNIFYDFFYNFFYKWIVVGAGCSDYISYEFDIESDTINFLGIFLCQHTSPSDLE